MSNKAKEKELLFPKHLIKKNCNRKEDYISMINFESNEANKHKEFTKNKSTGKLKAAVVKPVNAAQQAAKELADAMTVIKLAGEG